VAGYRLAVMAADCVAANSMTHDMAANGMAAGVAAAQNNFHFHDVASFH